MPACLALPRKPPISQPPGKISESPWYFYPFIRRVYMQNFSTLDLKLRKDERWGEAGKWCRSPLSGRMLGPWQKSTIVKFLNFSTHLLFAPRGFCIFQPTKNAHLVNLFFYFQWKLGQLVLKLLIIDKNQTIFLIRAQNKHINKVKSLFSSLLVDFR